jgi:hypothetical protein
VFLGDLQRQKKELNHREGKKQGSSAAGLRWRTNDIRLTPPKSERERKTEEKNVDFHR